MNDKPLLETEDLVRAISDCPPLSEGLRGRIMAEAVIARSRDSAYRRRERILSSCGLTLLVSLAAWTQSMLFFAHVPHEKQKTEIAETRPPAASASMTNKSSEPEGLSALMAMSRLGEWEHVDAMTRLREMNSRVFRGFSGL